MKKWRVDFSSLADTDLSGIYDFIALQNFDFAIADRYISRLEAFCDKLEYLPSRGRLRPEFGENIRSLVFEGRVTVFYTIEDISVVIIRIFYAGATIGKVDFTFDKSIDAM